MKRLAMCCGVFTVVAIALMLFYMNNRKVVYASEAVWEGEDVTLAEKIHNMSSEHGIAFENMTELNIVRQKEDGILISLSDNRTARGVTMVEDAVNRNVSVFIDGLEMGYFEHGNIVADQSRVTGCRIGYENGITQLMFSFDSIYECEISKENGDLRVKLMSPREIYDVIALIDVGHGSNDEGETENGASEKKIILKVAEKLRDIVGEKSIGLYFTRLSEVELDDEDRQRLAKMIDADVLISLHTAVDENPEKFGINVYYNGDYYVPGLLGVEFADILARNVAYAVYGRANGIYSADETRALVYYSTIPTVEIELGYLTNEKEAKLLVQEEYQQRLAEGIYQAICETWKKLDE